MPSTPEVRAERETETVAQLGRVISDLHSHNATLQTMLAEQIERRESAEERAFELDSKLARAVQVMEICKEVLEVQKVARENLKSDNENLRASIELAGKLRADQEAEIESLRKAVRKAQKVKA